jgi:hypothetical protein
MLHYTRLKRLAGANTSSFDTFVSYLENSLVNIAPGACTINLFTAVIYGFFNKL